MASSVLLEAVLKVSKVVRVGGSGPKPPPPTSKTFGRRYLAPPHAEPDLRPAFTPAALPRQAGAWRGNSEGWGSYWPTGRRRCRP
jgi:hypothetical protein